MKRREISWKRKFISSILLPHLCSNMRCIKIVLLHCNDDDDDVDDDSILGTLYIICFSTNAASVSASASAVAALADYDAVAL